MLREKYQSKKYYFKLKFLYIFRLNLQFGGRGGGAFCSVMGHVFGMPDLGCQIPVKSSGTQEHR
jgi:purine-nucleoside phosphorylase